MVMFSGYVADDKLPVKNGQVVTIVKGTKIRTMDPSQREKIAKRTYKVKIDHVLNGMSTHKYAYDEATGKPVDVWTPVHNPSVRWAGTGGYWYEVDLNDIPEATGKAAA